MRFAFLSLGTIIGYMASELHRNVGIFVVLFIAVLTVIFLVVNEWR